MDIKHKVEGLIKKYKTNDPYEIAEHYRSVHIIRHDLHESVRGLYQYYKNNRIIYINKNLNTHEQKIVCAHELGHAFLHTKLNMLFLEMYTFTSRNKIERQANAFAAELLLPDKIFRAYDGYSYQEIAYLEDIPFEMVQLKAERLQQK